MFSKIHESNRSYWNHTRNMHVKFEAVWRSYNFWWKNAYCAGPSKQDEILTFSQCSPKFMKLTKFIGITTRNMHVNCEVVWRSYNFWWKMPTAPDLQNRMKFWHFTMFSKIHETYRSYWNHHQKHACEIWGSLEKLQFLTEKCRQRRTLETGWNLTFSQCSPKFMTHTEFIGISTRNKHVKFEAVWRSYNFWWKMPTFQTG